MLFRQILRNQSGCASYLIGCGRGGTAAVIDPLAALGARSYALLAADLGLRITHVIETHMHADHPSAAQELAHTTGATLAFSHEAAVAYPFHPLHDGDIIEIGKVRLEVLRTPGHTPESICLLVTDTARAEQPWFLLSGDTLFPGDVGRPDLLLEDADAHAQTARQALHLHHSLFERLLTLEDTVEVYPGHFGGSACGGVNMSGKPMTTIGFERRWNLALQQRDPEAFVDFVLETLRPQPENYQQIKRANLQRWDGEIDITATLTTIRPADSMHQIQHGAVLVDLRSGPAFAQSHPRGALSVPFSSTDLAANLEKLLPPAYPLILIAENVYVAEESARILRESGWSIRGWLHQGLSDLDTTALETWTLEQLRQQFDAPDVLVVDVREPHEWALGVIPSAARIPQGELRVRQDELPRDRQLVTICAGGVRSARAASLLLHLGFPHVATIDSAGMNEWITREYPVEK